MTVSRLITLCAAGSLMAIASPVTAEAQNVATRISSAPDGKVRMTFAARSEICGFENGISTRPGHRNTWSSERSEDVSYSDECGYGPVRVVAEVRDGRAQRIRAYVGGRWRAPQGRVTDIGAVGVKDATSYLMSVASSQSGKVASDALYAATLADSVEMAEPFYNLARNEARPRETREQAIFWMSQLDDDRVAGLLEKILKESREEGIQDKAIFALSQHSSERSKAVLREFAERDGASEKLRGQAIFWLGQSRNGESPQYLRSLYSRVRSNALKDKVIFSVSQQRGADSEKWLLDLVKNPSESIEMRKKALFWAGQGGASTKELAALYSTMKEREMKDQMIFVFSQKRDGEAVDKLIDIARTDPDRDARRKALFWLGQSRDPRVASLLSDIINK